MTEVGLGKEELSQLFSIIIPKVKNAINLDDIPEEVRGDIEFNFVSNYEEIYNKLFVTKKNA